MKTEGWQYEADVVILACGSKAAQTLGGSIAGTMTKDLVGLWDGEIPARGVTSLEFIRAIRTELEKML